MAKSIRGLVFPKQQAKVLRLTMSFAKLVFGLTKASSAI